MEFKVMTFNIRLEAKIDGINELQYRKGRILETIENEKPDLIGFQEVSDNSRAWLKDALSDYVIVGCGRYAGYKGESAPLAFRKDRFELFGMDTFWLSCTPDIPGSKYDGSDQSVCPRIATAVALKPIDGESLFLFVNTHTDHKGEVSRMLASAQLLEYVSKKKLPTVMTGDFNALPDTAAIKMIISNKDCPMTDITANIEGTFHGFGKLLTDENYIKSFGGKAAKIDYIFTNMSADVSKSYAVTDDPVDGVYISDHQPVVGFVEL